MRDRDQLFRWPDVHTVIGQQSQKPVVRWVGMSDRGRNQQRCGGGENRTKWIHGHDQLDGVAPGQYTLMASNRNGRTCGPGTPWPKSLAANCRMA